MSVRKSRSGRTQARLLESAAEVFAEKGYRDATIAEICERAGANIAAVNYYFGDKETLYAEAWRLAFHRSLASHPPDGGVPPDAPAEQRLRGHVASMVQRVLDPENHEFDIVHKEHANPTGLLAEIMRESIEPLRRQLAQIVRELLGEAASERDVGLCQMSIMAQCLHIIVRHRHYKLSAPPGPPPGPPEFDFSVEEMTDHIIRFSLAGIRQRRRLLESSQDVEGQ